MSSVQSQSGIGGERSGAAPPGPDPRRPPLASARRPPDSGSGASGSAGEPPYGAPPPPGGGPYGGGGPHDASYGGPGSDPLAGMPPLAPLLRRLAARIIDALLIGIPVGLVSWAATGGYDLDEQMQVNWPQLSYLLIYFLYEGAMLSALGQTVGKKLMSIRVAMLEDGRLPRGVPGWLRAAVYSIPVLVPCCGSIFWLVNVVWCTGDRPYRQCLHDKAAKTVVVTG